MDDSLIMTTFADADWWLGFKKLHDEAMEEAKRVIDEVDSEYGRRFGRSYGGLIGEYRCDNASIAVVTMGSLSLTTRLVVNRFRERGVKVGLINLRALRTFLREGLLRALEGVEAVCVIEHNCSLTAMGGQCSVSCAQRYTRRG